MANNAENVPFDDVIMQKMQNYLPSLNNMNPGYFTLAVTDLKP